MSMSAKDASIVAQVAAKAAAELYSGTGDVDGYLAAVETIHEDLLKRLTFGDIDQKADRQVAAASNVVEAAFPGSQVVSDTTPQGQRSKTDQLWQMYFDSPGDWWDNRNDPRASINGGSGPDFRHKTLKNDKGYNLGLWLKPKHGSVPQWVLDRLGMSNSAPANPNLPPPF